MLDAIPDMIFRVTGDGHVSDFKPGKNMESHVPPVDFIGKRLRDVLPGGIAQSCVGAVNRAIKTKQIQLVEFQLPFHGESREYEARVVPLETGDALAIVRDIGRQGVRGGGENRVVLEAFPDMIFRLDRDGYYLDFRPSKEFEPFAPPAEFLGKRVTEVLPKDVAQGIMPRIRRAVDTKETQLVDYELPMPGGPRSYEARIVPLGQDDILAIVRDITGDSEKREHLPPSAGSQSNMYGITSREREVLRLLTAGLTDKVIAARLKISAMTVRKHVATLRDKMGAISRTDASVRTVREGLLD